jgi:hypothetical protein
MEVTMTLSMKKILSSTLLIGLLYSSIAFSGNTSLLNSTYSLNYNQNTLSTEALIHHGEIYINLTDFLTVSELKSTINEQSITLSSSSPLSVTRTNSDGDLYIGELQNNQPNGQGTQYLKNGGKYEGYWENGLYEGQGTLILENGSMYTGAFSKGFIHGEGKMIYPDASYYKGNYVYGIREGFGLLYIDKDNKYEGYWENGFRNGKGKAYIEGSYKKGLWENNKLIKRLSESDFNF